jgi:tetratricopeptide (TPR) repeat protein
MKKNVLILSLVLLGINMMVSAQKLDDVITLFNEAADKTNKAEYEAAIADFENLIVLAEQVGPEANDLKAKSQEQLPVLNWQLAAAELKQKKFEEAIPHLEKVVEYTSKFNTKPDLNERASRILPQVYTAVGTTLFRDKKYDEAIKLFDKAIKNDEGFTAGYLGKGLIYAEQDDEKNMIGNLEKAIELAKQQNDAKTVETATSRIARYYTTIGDMEREAMDEFDEDYTYPIEFYQKALSYDENYADANYWMAFINNKKMEYDAAIEYAQKALSTETDEVKIAAINFELGNAYTNTAQYDLACAAFNNALVGPIEEMALRRKEKVPGCN